MRNMEAPARLRAAIPGQSLTDEPRGYAWERPPEFNTPEEALRFYIPKITENETMQDILLALENGFPLSTLVKGIYMNGVMDGKHSIDVGLLIAPVLHEIILSTAKRYRVPVKELPVSPQKQKEQREANRISASVERELETGLSEDESLEESMVTRDEGAEIAPEEQQNMEKEEPKGLMSRNAQ